MRLILVDDEPLALGRLTACLRDMPGVEVIATAADGAEASRLIAQLRPDLVLLDIQMPELPGLALGTQLAAMPWRPEIIFITAFDRYAAEAFAIEAADYLLKPVSADRLSLGIERARRRRAARDAEGRAAELEVIVEALRTDARQLSGQTPDGARYDSALWVPVRSGQILVPVETINSIEAAKDYVMLNTDLKAHILRATMGELERRLDPRLILRVHRSHMVRLGAVAAIERPGRGAVRLQLHDGTRIQVGPLYVDEVVAALGLPGR
jgi:DNA-binding LytR/AlgR family response regulator